jgi:hypothetical protein
MQRDRCDDLSIWRTVGPEGWRLKRAHMARGMISLAVVVILTAMLPSPAGAQPLEHIGNFCWSLNPFVDTLLLEVTSVNTVFALDGRGRATGGNAAGGANGVYQLLGSGTATPSITQGNTIDVGFQAVHNTTFFGGNHGCNLYASINTLSLNGTWALQCPGPTTFTTQGNLISANPCPGNF